jgi:hypothetical protein
MESALVVVGKGLGTWRPHNMRPLDKHELSNPPVSLHWTSRRVSRAPRGWKPSTHASLLL